MLLALRPSSSASVRSPAPPMPTRAHRTSFRLTTLGTQVLGAELLELLLQQRSFFQDVLLHDGVSVTAIATSTVTSRRVFRA